MKKRTLLMLSASMFMAAGLAACNKEREGSAAEDQGDPTTATLIMSFKETNATRATTDANAIDAEAAIKTVDVFIYTSGGDYLSHTALSSTDFTGPTAATNADAYTSATLVPTTTGVKNILVGVNLPADAITSLTGKSMSTASTEVQTIARTAVNTTAGLPMFSTAATNFNMQTDATQNKITATVERIVAKVTVQKSATMQQEGAAGTLGNFQWAVNNQNTKYFLIQGNSPSYPDPNWATGSYAAGDFAAATDTDYVAVADATASAPGDYVPAYAMENTSDAKTQQELDRVTVRATFIPAQWVTSYTAGSKTVTNTANANSTPVTFYTVSPSIGTTYYFQNQTDADNYHTDMGGTESTYTGGMCYWNVFLNNTHQGEVYRNDYYKCTITRVVAPGNSTDTLTTPTAQVGASTDLTMNVNILYWNTPILENKELVP